MIIIIFGEKKMKELLKIIMKDLEAKIRRHERKYHK